MAKNLDNAAKPQPLRGYLLLAEPPSESTKLYFLVTGLSYVLLLKLMKYVAVSDPGWMNVLGPATLDLHSSSKWMPCHLSLFIEPRKFNDDKEDVYWCLMSKVEALSLLRDWQEDPRYTAAVKADGQNYYKNTVDLFEEKMEKRKW